MLRLPDICKCALLAAQWPRLLRTLTIDADLVFARFAQTHTDYDAVTGTTVRCIVLLKLAPMLCVGLTVYSSAVHTVDAEINL
jgi:hypothetical protein